jgi:hypothetical protein
MSRVIARCIVVIAILWSGLFSNLACGGSAAVPVYQVSGQRLSPWNGRTLEDAEVRQILVRAATLRRWTVEREEPGVIFARIVSGQHEAVVRMDYNSAGYSVSYVDSSPSLRYDGVTIHRRYNHWVRLLDDAIQKEFGVYEKLPTAGGSQPPPPVLEPAPPPVEAAPEAPAGPATGLAPAAPAPAPAAAPLTPAPEAAPAPAAHEPAVAAPAPDAPAPAKPKKKPAPK